MNLAMSRSLAAKEHHVLHVVDTARKEIMAVSTTRTGRRREKRKRRRLHRKKNIYNG